MAGKFYTAKQYRRAYSDESFLKKVAVAARGMGRVGLRLALLLYYVLKRKDIPMKHRLLIVAALGYFILPFDIIPDVVPLLGYTDDVSVLMAALGTVMIYIDESVREKAEEKVVQWLGEED